MSGCFQFRQWIIQRIVLFCKLFNFPIRVLDAVVSERRSDSLLIFASSFLMLPRIFFAFGIIIRKPSCFARILSQWLYEAENCKSAVICASTAASMQVTGGFVIPTMAITTMKILTEQSTISSLDPWVKVWRSSGFRGRPGFGITKLILAIVATLADVVSSGILLQRRCRTVYDQR